MLVILFELFFHQPYFDGFYINLLTLVCGAFVHNRIMYSNKEELLPCEIEASNKL